MVFPVPLTPTRKVTLGGCICGAASRPVGAREEWRLSCSLQELAQLLAALNGLMAGAVAQGVENSGGGGNAEVAGEQRRFEVLKCRLVDGASEGGNISDFGQNDSRVRETAWRMRSKKFFLGSSSEGFSGSRLPRESVSSLSSV